MPSNTSQNSGVPPAGDGGMLKTSLSATKDAHVVLKDKKSKRCSFQQKRVILAWSG